MPVNEADIFLFIHLEATHCATRVSGICQILNSTYVSGTQLMVYRPSSMWVNVSAFVYIHLYGYGLTKCMYMCVHIEAKTYLHENHQFFSASIKCRCQVKMDQ